MSIPVSSLNGARLAAIADVGAVFSEMKFSVVPGELLPLAGRGIGLHRRRRSPRTPASQPGTASAAAPMPAR